MKITNKGSFKAVFAFDIKQDTIALCTNLLPLLLVILLVGKYLAAYPSYPLILLQATYWPLERAVHSLRGKPVRAFVPEVYVVQAVSSLEVLPSYIQPKVRRPN